MPIQTVVITGASSGIGQSLALRLASKELVLVLTGRDASQLNTLTAHCKVLGARAESVVGDITNSETIQKISECCSDLPPLAGLGHVDKWRSHMRIDVMSTKRRKLSAVLS